MGANRLAKVETQSGEIYTYLNDRLGTPQLMTDSTNTVVWEATYDPFGQAWINPSSSVVNNFRFPGQYYDEETGFYYNWNRYYDPSTGRYLTPDPIGLAGGINLFLYAEANPVNIVDPRGLLCKFVRDDPVPAGDPLFTWDEEKNIGLISSLATNIAANLFGLMISPKAPPGLYIEFIKRHTTWQTYELYVYWWWVCSDDCSGKETSRKFLHKYNTNKYIDVRLDKWDEKIIWQ